MRSFAVVLLAAITLVALFGEAQAQPRMRPRGTQGLELLGGVGLNVCLESGNSTCDNADPSVSMLAAVGYRFSRYFGAYLDFNYGLLTPDGELGDAGNIDQMYAMSVMPTGRFFFELKDAELFFGAGFGYARTGITAGDTDTYWNSWTNFKLLAGGGIEIWPRLFLGGELDLIYNRDDTGEYCVDAGAMGKQCTDAKVDIIDIIQVNAFVKYRF